jgi:uncharacterized membrane protein
MEENGLSEILTGVILIFLVGFAIFTLTPIIDAVGENLADNPNASIFLKLMGKGLVFITWTIYLIVSVFTLRYYYRRGQIDGSF